MIPSSLRVLDTISLTCLDYQPSHDHVYRAISMALDFQDLVPGGKQTAPVNLSSLPPSHTQKQVGRALHGDYKKHKKARDN